MNVNFYRDVDGVFLVVMVVTVDFTEIVVFFGDAFVVIDFAATAATAGGGIVVDSVVIDVDDCKR